MIIQILAAFLAVVVSSIFLEVPRKLIFRAGFVGALGWAVYLLLLDKFGLIVSTYIAGLAVSTVSHIFSRTCRTPVTVFFIPGFFPLVPGTGIYLAVYYFIAENGELAQSYLSQTIKVSGMIALSVFTIDTVFNVINKLKNLIPQD